MSEGKPPQKMLLRDAMDKAGESQHSLARALKFSFSTIQRAAYQSVDAERAGKICRHLSGKAELASKDRKALFAELVNRPGAGRSLVKRVSTEDPRANIEEGVKSNLKNFPADVTRLEDPGLY